MGQLLMAEAHVVTQPSQATFLHALGLEGNPFEFTNADLEERLAEYFVPPPYFHSVYGDPDQPTSCIVFAPRGAGKSAQRRMVEANAPLGDVLCVTYDTFRPLEGRALRDMTIDDHILNVSKIMIVGLLSWLSENDASRRLDQDERNALRSVALGLLSTATRQELESALSALRNLTARAKDLWNRNRWAVNAVLSSIAIASGGTGGYLHPAEDDEPIESAPAQHLEMIGRIASQAGLKAIYILIDRVDETAETSADPSTAYSMIAALMQDLRLLELRPLAFKFFVPDNIQPFYQSAGGRSDRVRTHEATWRNAELREMMSRRLGAYSSGRVTSLEQVLGSPDNASRFVQMTIWVAHRSPRDLIRIWARALAEQLRTDPSAAAISRDSLIAGVDAFCHERADEIATANAVRDLTRVARVDFTVTELASHVFHQHTNSARARIQGWESRGILRQIGEVPARRRPHKLYGIVDVRVARAMFPHLELNDFWQAKARVCSSCEAWVLRDFDDSAQPPENTCTGCGVPLTFPNQ